MGMEFSATQHLSPIHKQPVGISTGASYRAHIVSSKMNKHYHSMKTSYLLELFFPLFFFPPTYPSVLWFRSLSLGSWWSFLSTKNCRISSNSNTQTAVSAIGWFIRRNKLFHCKGWKLRINSEVHEHFIKASPVK